MTDIDLHPDELLDWPGCVARARSVLDWARPRPNEWRRTGTNFATPECLGYVRAHDGTLVEITTGMMPVFGERPRRETRVYGVTFNPPHDDRSRLCRSFDEIKEALR
jgi:hypothetical protein